ncbi:MAG: hypothetical protein RI900_12 [Actinomycetota bacterium]
MRRPPVFLACALAAAAVWGPVAPVHGAAPAVTSVVLDGHGNGHGVGLSQWGAYGYAVDHGWSAAQILDHYYGGTVAGTVPLDTRVKVRLTNLDAAQTAVSVETGELVVDGVAGGPWRSVLVRESAVNGVYTVWARPDTQRCPAPTGDPVGTGWTLVADAVATKVDVRTLADSLAVTDHRELAAVCEPNGTVRWYRGTIRALNDAAGANRTVNELPLEHYLRTVIAMEMSPGWATAGGGKGAQALQAQAVAARSYALAYKWYAYADVCDMTCQSYFGVAFQTSGGSLRKVEAAATDAAVLATAGIVRRVGTTAGPIAITMFSASNGGHTAPFSPANPLIPFPAVPDEGDDTVLNPKHDWTVTLTGAAITAKYPALGSLTGIEVLSRNGYGEWGGRVLQLRLVGSASTMTVTGAGFRSKMGLSDTWFNVRTVNLESGPVSPPVTPPVTPPVDVCQGHNAPPVVGPMAPAAGARFTALTPQRIVDTRDGTGTNKAKLLGGCTMVVDPGLDPAVTAVAVNITAVRAGANGFIAAYPCGVARPIAAAVQAVSGKVVGGMTVVPLGLDGTFCVYSHASTDLVVDLFGSYEPGVGQRYEPIVPGRLFDSRGLSAPLPAGTLLRVKVAGVKVGAASVPATATGAALTLHAMGATSDGFLRAYPCAATMPAVASATVNTGGSVTNHAEVLLGGGEVCVYVSAPMHVAVDISGWFGPTATAEYYAVTPVRAVDTRNGTGMSGSLTKTNSLGSARSITLAGVNGLPPATALRAVMANVVGVGATGAGFITVHPCQATAPSVSMVRYVVGSNAAASVAGVDDSSGRWCFTASSTVHVVVDVNGWFA